MGSIQSILKMIPGLPKEMRNAEVDDKELKRVEAIIRSMTPSERDNPQIINGSRRLRIAKGSGTTTTDVNKLLKEFKMMQQLMKSAMGRPGKKGRAMPGGLPAGFPGVPGR
jgi:signal recognition particle subunit SRP54